MSCIPLSWIRAAFSSQDRELEDGSWSKARINVWLGELIDEGCPPWDRNGGLLREVPVGWFPEEEWTPYDRYDFGEDVGECPW